MAQLGVFIHRTMVLPSHFSG